MIFLACASLLVGADLASDESYLSYQNADGLTPSPDGVDLGMTATPPGVLAVRLWRSKMSARLLLEVSAREIHVGPAAWSSATLPSVLVSEQDLFRRNGVYRI